MQTCQLKRILRETHAKGQSLTLTRKHKIISRILIFNPVSTDWVYYSGIEMDSVAMNALSDSDSDLDVCENEDFAPPNKKKKVFL